MNPRWKRMYNAAYIGIENRMMVLMEKWNVKNNLPIQSGGLAPQSGEIVRDDGGGDIGNEQGLVQPDSGDDNLSPDAL